MKFRFAQCLLLLSVCLLGAVTAARAQPRIAVWDPQKSTNGSNFDVNAEYLTHVAQVLDKNGVKVTRLTAEQIADAATFGVDKFDGLFIDGGGVPDSNIKAYQTFAKAGGVLVALAGSANDHQQAFGVKVKQNEDGTWSPTPKGKGYPWQTDAIYDLIGVNFKFQIDMAYGGVSHTPSALLKRYLPDAPELIKPLPSRWFVPKDGGKFYPLIRSQFASQDDYTPQAFIAVAGDGKAKGIIVGSPTLTNGKDGDWKKSDELIVAIAKICADLHSGKLDLTAEETVTPVSSVVKPGPLQIRPPGIGVNPEQAKALLRWGKFDGARAEFGESLAAGKSKTMNPGDAVNTFPASIEPGATLELKLPAEAKLPQKAKTYLRVRGAYAGDGVGLKVAVGDQVVWNESFVSRTAFGAVDQGRRYDNIPYEFTRIIFLPATVSGDTITLSNPGESALWFDAVQVEQPTKPAPTRGMGLHSGVSMAFSQKNALTPEIVKDWTWMRCTSRPHFIGAPGDPKRWDSYDKMLQSYFKLTPHVQLILEGSPSWTVSDKERLKAGGGRGQMTPPDNALYAGLVEDIVTKYADQVEDWEIWNEQNITYFWTGTADEYAALFKTLAPIIRRLDPTAKVIIGGHAGTVTASLDPWVSAAVANGLTKEADLFAFHAYAPNGVFDLPYGLFEGHLMNRGGEIEIYPNEQGYEWNKIGETAQGHYMNIGLARLLANGVAKVTIFAGGGDEHGYGVIDSKAKPRPAYASIHDYMLLAADGARRLDVSMTGPQGKPVRGVYCAASVRADGGETLVLNPADTDALQMPREIVEGFDGNDQIMKWQVFFGSKKASKGTAVIEVSEGKSYAGFFKKMNLDPARQPVVEVNVPECDGKYQLLLKWPDGKIIQAIKDGGVGKVSVNYANMAGGAPKGEQTVEVSFRFYGKRMAIDELRFPAQPLPEVEPIPVHLVLPYSGPAKPVVTATESGKDVAVSAKRVGEGEASTLELDLKITGRTLIRVNGK